MNCWWHQWRISRAADDGRSIGNGTQRHIAHCERCRTFAAQVQAMDRLLGGDAPPVLSITPRTPHGLRFVRYLAAAAVIIVAGIVVYSLRPITPRSAPPAGGLSLAAIVTQSANAVQSPMQKQLDLMVNQVASAAEALVPPWPTPQSDTDATVTP